MTRCTQTLSAALLLLTATSAMAHSGHGESGLTAGLAWSGLGLPGVETGMPLAITILVAAGLGRRRVNEY